MADETLNVPIRLSRAHLLTSGEIRFFNEPMSVGVPFPKGKLHSPEDLVLSYNQAQSIAFDAQISAYWPDNSIKWLTLAFQLPAEQIQDDELILRIRQESEKTPKANDQNHALDCIETRENLTLKGRSESILVSKEQLQPFSFENSSETNLHTTTSLIDKNGDAATSQISKTSIDDSQKARILISQQGEFINSDQNTLANFRSKLHFYHQAKLVKWTFTIHNTNSAEHSNGLWDLGDPGSLFFQKLSVTVPRGRLTDLECSLDSELSISESALSNFHLEQHSSGGEKWNSNTHLNAEQRVPMNHKGYALKVNDSETSGLRAEPIVTLSSDKESLHIALKKFWQNFPKAISVNDEEIELALFPKTQDDCHELQAGESKTHTVYFSYSSSPDALDWLRKPSHAYLDSIWYSECGMLPTFDIPSQESELQSLVHTSLEGPNNFFDKREQIDEFGWRNFGDVFADHESLYQEDGNNLISHYNNQYDLVLGFAKQYIATSDKRWFELMDDLATHVFDIDIYKTKADRAEYNGGLFWHTDHYLDAGTSSHRTYSKLQLEELETEDHGGGPGGQHCYTTGLLVHYLLTGNERSKEGVLSLSQWIENNYEGTGSLLETLLAFKNRAFPGYKNAFSNGHQYPLDRGIGNYIVALLDRHTISGDDQLIVKVEHIISRTVHPNDDLAAREFDNVEDTWFYTVFFQAVLRYLHLKEEHQQFDDAFYYARDCLLHYASWMLDNETPYLSKPEILDYPNDTWTAQDIRKANILYGAYYFGDACETLSNRALKDKADYFHNYVLSTLSESKERGFSRLQAILMQNSGVKSFYLSRVASTEALKPSERDYGPAPASVKTSKISLLFLRLLKICIKPSIKKELDWIKARS